MYYFATSQTSPEAPTRVTWKFQHPEVGGVKFDPPCCASDVGLMDVPLSSYATTCISPLPVIRHTILISCFATTGWNNNAHSSVFPSVVPCTSGCPIVEFVIGEGGLHSDAPSIGEDVVLLLFNGVLDGEDGEDDWENEVQAVNTISTTSMRVIKRQERNHNSL
jgi:hypothetical protein